MFNMLLSKPIISFKWYGRAKSYNSLRLIALGLKERKKKKRIISWTLTKLKFNKSKRDRKDGKNENDFSKYLSLKASGWM